jgi:putative ABC transport system permease protein
VRAATQRLQNIRGAQVVTLTEMMGTFLNLVGTVRTLLFSIALVAITISGLGVFNTLLGAVVERSNELCILRAIGASRFQILGLIATEALLLASIGSLSGILLAFLAGHGLENLVKQIVPLAPVESLMVPNLAILIQTALLGTAMGVLGGLYPAWRASRLYPAEALKAE